MKNESQYNYRTSPSTWYDTCHDSPIMKALRLENNKQVPIWLMRQAGRYLAEYRAMREKISFLELCKTPRLAAEVMQATVEKLGVDAAIIFSDLLLILQPLGFDLEYTQDNGPVIHNPIRSADDLTRIHDRVNLGDMEYVFDTVETTRSLIDPSKPLIGFVGGPFTLAAYAIEGGYSRDFSRTKAFMRAYPAVWQELLSRLGRAVTHYLRAQIDAGVQVVQVFDTWAGCLSVSDYERFVLTPTKRLVESVVRHAPLIYFSTGNPALCESFALLDCDAISVDWRIEIGNAWRRIGYDRAIQGNLDPSILLTNESVIRREALRILESVGKRPGFIFNLGHGIHKDTPVENVIALVKAVHEFDPS